MSNIINNDWIVLIAFSPLLLSFIVNMIGDLIHDYKMRNVPIATKGHNKPPQDWQI